MSALCGLRLVANRILFCIQLERSRRNGRTEDEVTQGLEAKGPRWGSRSSKPAGGRDPVAGAFDSHSLPPNIQILPCNPDARARIRSSAGGCNREVKDYIQFFGPLAAFANGGFHSIHESCQCEKIFSSNEGEPHGRQNANSAC